MRLSAELQRKFDKAKARLVLDHKFFGSIVLSRDIVWTDSVPTASMSPRGVIRINPAFAEPLTVAQIQFLLAHEAMHFMLSHSLRRKHRDPNAWNVACDLVVNDTLINAKVGDFIDGGATFDGARDQSAEELYQEPPEGEGGSGSPSPGGTGSDVEDPANEDGTPLDESDIAELETKAKVEMLQAAKAATKGSLPASLQRMVDEIIAIHTPWHQLLENFMNGRIKDGYSWARPNRRFIGSGVYLPGQDYLPKIGEVVIGVDTSGSIGQKELNEFNAHINRILESCGPERVHVVYCDAAVNHVDTFEPEDFPVTCKPYGGGGTSFKPVFDWVAKEGLSPEVVVYLTDGYGDQQSLRDPGYPVVWLTTANADFTFGKVVEFKPEG